LSRRATLPERANSQHLRSPKAGLRELLSSPISRGAQLPAEELLDPRLIFDVLAYDSLPSLRRYYDELFDVVVAPGETLESTLQPGDLLLRRGLGEGGLVHLDSLVNGELLTADDLAERNLSGEARAEGLFAEVVWTQASYGEPLRGLARRLTNERRRLPQDQIILRLRDAREASGPSPHIRGFDAAIEGRGKYAAFGYLFRGPWYIRYNWKTIRQDQDWRPLSRWKGVEKVFPNGLDGGISGEGQHGGKTLLIQGETALIYDWSSNRTDGVLSLSDALPGLPKSFFAGIDAALEGREAFTGLAYFFKDSDWIGYDWGGRKVVAQGKLKDWALPKKFHEGIDAALNGAVSRARYGYFFRGNEYIRYDWRHRRLDPPRVRPVTDMRMKAPTRQPPRLSTSGSVDPISIIDGWLNLPLGGWSSPVAFSSVKIHTSGAAAFAAFHDAVGRCAGENALIVIAGWDFHESTPLKTGTTVGDALREAATQRRVRIRALFNHFPVIDLHITQLFPVPGNNAGAVAFVRGLPDGAAIHDAWVLHHVIPGHIGAALGPVQLGVHHQKAWITYDGEDRLTAWIGGVDFNPNRTSLLPISCMTCKLSSKDQRLSISTTCFGNAGIAIQACRRVPAFPH
jgi:hypothetical protein